MSKQKMLQVQELIKAKRFDEARVILKTVQHPTAEAWLAKLDAKAPAPKKKRVSEMQLAIILVVVVAAIVGGVWFVMNQAGQAGRDKIDLRFRLEDYCMAVVRSVDDDITAEKLVADCSQWAQETVNSVLLDKVMACNQLSPELDRPFEDCLIDENILPPGISRR